MAQEVVAETDGNRPEEFRKPVNSRIRNPPPPPPIF
jgi:hypothetical protein